MKVSPPKRPRWRPWALITPGWRSVAVTTDTGTEHYHGALQVAEGLQQVEGHVCYVEGNLSHLRHTTGATLWTADTWRGRATRMHLAGTKVSVTTLRNTLSGYPDPASELDRALSWFRDQGVPPGSISGMAWNLWRSTLPHEVDIRGPSWSRDALYGGRQEAREAREYQGMKAVDITAAYPTAMADRPYPLTLRAVSPATTLDPALGGLARARVWVDTELPHPPLPVRVAADAIQWQWGVVEGVWPWVELAAAAAIGCRVEVIECWAPAREVDLFGEWWERVREGRALGGGAGRLVKAVSNSLWGLFAMTGDQRAQVRWTDDIGDRSMTIGVLSRRLPHAMTAHVAAETSARVRARMLLEGLYGGPYHPVHVDTDGIIIRKSAPLPAPYGDQPGQWRTKTTMPRVDIRAPQVYRHTCGAGCGITHPQWHYVASGLPPTAAAHFFRKVPHGVRVGVRGMDLVLPPGHAAERALLAAAYDTARALQTEVYGPPLGIDRRGSVEMLPRPTEVV